MQRKEWNHDIYRKKAECRSLEVKRIEFVKAGAVKEKEQLSYHVGGAHWRSGQQSTGEVGSRSLVQSPLDRSLGLLTCCEGSSRRTACASSLSHVTYTNLYPARLPKDSLLISIWKSLMIVTVQFSQFVKHIQFRTCHVKPDLDTRFVNISDPRISNGWHVLFHFPHLCPWQTSVIKMAL